MILKGDPEEKGFAKKVWYHLRELPVSVQQAIAELLSAWEDLHRRQVRMYARLGKLVQIDERIALLASYPGIGPATASAYVATIDDPRRFSSGSKVGAYLGLVPSIYQSGDTEYRGRITKTGDKLLRWLLVEAASVLLTHTKDDSPLKLWGLELKEKKGYGKACVAVARKLAGLLHYAWIHNEPYRAAV